MFYATVEARARSWILEAMAADEAKMPILAECCRQIAEDILNGK